MTYITNIFGFRTRLDVIDDDSIKIELNKSVNNLVKIYFRNLEESFYGKSKQFVGTV